MTKNHLPLNLLIICVILFSQLALPQILMAQGTVPDQYARKLQAYDPRRLALTGPATNADSARIGPLLGSYLGSPWDNFTFAAYDWQGSSSWDIFFYNESLHSGTAVPLAPGASNELQPRLSRQSNKIVFISDRSGTHFNIFTINPDGTGLKQLTKDNMDEVYPSFSPDGSQIVFQSYRDGQPEIYKMKADGTGRTRLTTNSAANTDYDGMPAWSPDGSYIAFVTNRSGQNTYQLWLMNADGSNQHLLVDQPWCAHPSWSGDGKKIAFDAAATMSAYQSVWVYLFDTGLTEQEAASNTNIDYEVNAFMPGGRYVGFTMAQNDAPDFVTFINSLDNYGVEIQDHTDSMKPMFFRTVDNEIRSFDWQSADALPPVTTIQPAPAMSPATFTIYWSGQDAGPAGIDSYEIEYRDSPTASWQSGIYYPSGESLTATGTTGQKFYFRVRAIDKAENIEAWKPENEWVVTIENLPPHLVLYPAPRYAPYSGVTLNWLGWDDGGSGIDHYDFTTQTDALCTGSPCFTRDDHTFRSSPGSDFYFYARAVDKAGNASNWVQMPNKVAFYYSAVSGHVLNNQGFPVSGAQVDLAGSQLAAFPSDINGNYLAYTNTSNPNSTAGWAKPGYGSPDRWQYGTAPLVARDVYLPPADNLIANGGFEHAITPADWQAGGNTPAKTSNESPYLGKMAADLGGPSFTVPDAILNNCKSECTPQIVVSPSGTIHLIWQDAATTSYRGDLYYAQKPAGGTWSSPERIIADPVTNPIGLDNFTMVESSDGTLHLIYASLINLKVYDMTRPPAGPWSSPTVLFDGAPGGSTYARGVSFSVKADNSGALHLIVTSRSNPFLNLFYFKWSGGVWSSPMQIGETYTSYYDPEFSFVLDKNNLLTVVVNFQMLKDMVFIRQLSGNVWAASGVVPTGMEREADITLATDGNGIIHMIFDNIETTGACLLYYMSFDPVKNQWTTPIMIGPAPYGGRNNRLITSKDGKVYLLWGYIDNNQMGVLKFRALTPGIGWSDINLPVSLEYQDYRYAINQGSDGSLHFLIQNKPDTLVYFQFTADEKFTAPITIWKSSDSLGGFSLALTPDVQPQFFWWNSTINPETSINYSGRQIASQDGASTLSQAVSIPDMMQNPGLSFLYQVFGPPASGSDFKVTVTDGAGTSTIFSAAGENQGYRHTWVDMSQWKGKQVTLTFSMSHHQGQPNPEAMLDEVSLGETYPDGWIDFSPADMRGLPAQELTLTLHYGAHGLPLDQVAISLQLPTGIEFVSASAQPMVTGDMLSWGVGNLSPQDGDQSINLVVRVKPDAPAFNAFDLKACLASPTAELETMNNCAQNTIRSQVSNYFPMVNK